MRPLHDVQQVDFIFSRDNPLSKASNLLPTDPMARFAGIFNLDLVGRRVRRRNNARHRA